jgi:heme oxygenase
MMEPIPDLDSPLHAQLRAATKLPHHALDHHPLLTPLLRPAPRLDDYAAALAALHGVYAVAEAAILDFLAPRPGLFDYAARRKLPALEADLVALAALGHSGTPVTMAGQSLPPLTNVGELVGMLYTIEGSTRGGRFIYRQLRQGLGEAAPLSFFAGYGEASEQRWQEFWQFANNRCPQQAFADAVRIAAQLFGAIKSHLDSCCAAGANAL